MHTPWDIAGTLPPGDGPKGLANLRGLQCLVGSDRDESLSTNYTGVTSLLRGVQFLS